MEEKKGGSDNERRDIGNFLEALNDCNLRDLGFIGQWFTWERGRTMAKMVQGRLDCFCANKAWFDLFPDFQVEHFVRVKSDHSPIFIRQKRPKRKRRRGKKSFKFETARLLEASCEQTVKSAWSDSEGRSMLDRLCLILGSLRNWSGKRFIKFNEQLDSLEKELQEMQRKDISEDHIRICTELERKREEVLDKQEAYWYLRSRTTEIKDGD
ncbi:uncharacterized protein LOC110711937 [Chenopodium quinoa]|uniref:uncharacterized protein LOC110711937 n=1 Tax=Chenopodium quinoa TaxID=63459 RepID=UPI000B78BF9E|nr:uncharacterized protein LOC110711937 [Chenopodium quinoa]